MNRLTSFYGMLGQINGKGLKKGVWFLRTVFLTLNSKVVTMGLFTNRSKPLWMKMQEEVNPPSIRSSQKTAWMLIPAF